MVCVKTLVSVSFCISSLWSKVLMEEKTENDFIKDVVLLLEIKK